MHAPLIIDATGLHLTDGDRTRLAHLLVGGVTLCGRNRESREQLTALCRQIKAVRRDLLIAVDHEGEGAAFSHRRFHPSPAHDGFRATVVVRAGQGRR